MVILCQLLYETQHMGVCVCNNWQWKGTIIVCMEYNVTAFCPVEHTAMPKLYKRPVAHQRRRLTCWRVLFTMRSFQGFSGFSRRRVYLVSRCVFASSVTCDISERVDMFVPG